jgi:hypothetical protein
MANAFSCRAATPFKNVGLGLQQPVCKLLNLKLATVRRVLAPIGNRRLSAPEFFGQLHLSPEVTDCFICSHLRY